MTPPTAAHLEWARQCLAREGGESPGEAPGATPAARVHDKLHAVLAPLVGDVGVQLLFVRSAKLTQGELAWINDVSILDGSAKLRAALQATDPAISAESAATLFATFFTLLATFIGERMTTQLVGRAWPALDDELAPEIPK